jgi:hypothetical protein
MGQAKLRGTFEERKAKSVEKAAVNKMLRDEFIKEQLANRTPEEVAYDEKIQKQREIHFNNMIAIKRLIGV